MFHTGTKVTKRRKIYITRMLLSYSHETLKITIYSLKQFVDFQMLMCDI